MKNVNVTVSYDADADVLALEGSRNATIDHAKEMGNLVVHFSDNDEPVLVEVLEASKTLRGQSVPFTEIAEAAKA